jgi:Rad3-related DNA helicase
MHMLPQPTDLGLPQKFSQWRPGQVRAILDLVDSNYRFFTQIQPTGSGKSLCYITASLLRGGRTLILTSLKGLQKQLADDFGESPGLAVVMGKSSYTCPLTHQSCEWAPCNFGSSCIKRQSSGCPYHDAIRRAQYSDIVVTNYAFWHSNRKDRLGQFDLLVCDEAHNAVNHLVDSLSLTVSRRALSGVDIQWPGESDNLWEWATSTYRLLDTIIKDKVQQLKLSVKGATSETFKRLHKLKQRFEKLTKQDPEQWVIEYLGDSITFDPLWPPEFAESLLFRDIPSILLTSATMGRSTLSMLGVPTVDSIVREYPSYFPVNRRPVYYIPTTRVDFRITNLGYGLWCSRIDQIISKRLDRKGIIHTVSYDRCSRVMRVSEYSKYMHTHKSRDIMKSLEKFRSAGTPAILCSPSVVTGWDFPYSQCEYQIIGKVPFPDARRKVDKARREKDPDYSCCMAMQNLVQTCGRGMRYPDDQCENMIIDDHFVWFVRKYERFAPKWWLDAVVTVRTIPEPPKRLVRR